MSARKTALMALMAYRRNNAWSDRALSGLIEKSDISARDAALATHIFNGVLQNMALCDYDAAKFSSIGLKKVEPRVLDILRISIYQIIFLTKIPYSAAVSEGVELAKTVSNPRAAGFVNAVLRKVSEAAANGRLPEIVGKTETERLSIKYSHPEWLVREFCGILGEDGTESLLAANNLADTPVTAQINTLRAGTDDVLSMLEAEGVSVRRHPWLPDCIELHSAGSMERLDAFTNGYLYVQDAAARLAVIAAGVKPCDCVIDGCAAPGGKSFASAIAMRNTGRVTACDINESKLRHIESGATRLGIGIIEPVCRDAAVHSDEYSGTADVVIADVPCSGLGVIRKKTEIRYKDERDIAALPDVQKRIIRSLSSYVKPGGTLLYSTCTVLKHENEDIAEWFLAKSSGFRPEDFELPGDLRSEGGRLTLWPHIHGTDGFFICKFRREP